ncbi:MAG: hypothetical protein ABI254_11025, partial [Chthoniobacterales bacterium]
GWEIRGYTPEEHLRIFREAVESGEYKPGILRLMAYGNPALEKIVGKVRPEDIDLQSFLKKNPQFDK